jgi:UDP-3-O-[3-hydroxymyristoyl] glucosamine N-acyltransferase
VESVVESAFIHPVAEISPDAVIGAGTSLSNQVKVRAGARVGAACNIGKNVYIDANRIRLRCLPGTLTVGRCVGTSTASWGIET